MHKNKTDNGYLYIKAYTPYVDGVVGQDIKLSLWQASTCERRKVMNDFKLYYINNIGCDDETCGLARMTDAELERFASIVKDLNKNSTCRCMPIIEVYRISEDMLREPTEDDAKYKLLYLEGKPYVLDDAWYVRLGEKGEMVV